MFSPDPALGSAAPLPASLVFQRITVRKPAETVLGNESANQKSKRRSRAAEFCRVAAPKQERLFLGGCLLMFWLMNAASLSGYVILIIFILVALGRLAKHSVTLLAERLPRRSRSRQYLIACASAAFFSLLAVRGCYIAAVIVDSQFRTDPLQIYSSRR
ncbi:hypothetical protein H009_17698 [Agrobacterium tumefaciens str. Cherry 2E-2-2]|nr:hypothetical protein H009_17698 [Agrobacterium tumefaciens str. Cherry 2E-2-2]